jgi:hypothetical protein
MTGNGVCHKRYCTSDKAFVVSWKKKSFPVAGLLAASGAILMKPRLIAKVPISHIVSLGPTIGVTFGLINFWAWAYKWHNNSKDDIQMLMATALGAT